jgi:peptide deformylase|tara:strand:- start:341 stop:883 length:543 start_codon:yes stop_codon:yes gene_type:complete
VTVRKVIKMGNPLLREVAKEFTKDEILSEDMQDLITDMWDTMYAYDGIGLAAPQIGLSRQLAVIHLEEDSERYPELVESKKFIIFNPSISVLDETKQEFWEGCLSVPGLRGPVSRPRKIKVDYLDENAKENSIELEDFLATVFQHELDHLFGKLFVDRMEDISLLAYEEELLVSKDEVID